MQPDQILRHGDPGPHGRHRNLRFANGPWLHGLFLAGITALLSLAPNVGTLGYFAAFLLSPCTSLVAIDIGRRQGAHATIDLQNSQGAWAWWPFVVAGAQALAWLCGPSLALLALAHVWNPTCDVAQGLAFFALGPVLCALIGWSCGFWASLYASGWRAKLLAYAPFALSLALGLWRLYKQPVVFAFDPFWGWLSGPIYDESIAVDTRYLLYRVYNLQALLAIWLIVGSTWGGTGWQWRNLWPKRTSDRAAALMGMGLLLGVAVIFDRADVFGFTATTASLRQELSLTRRTEHFIIYYAPGSPTAREIDVLAAEHEFAWARLKALLNREPQAPIESFVFPSGASKRRAFGAGQTEVSLPWRGQIYLNHQEFPHTVLHHELAHAFGRSFGDAWFGLSFRNGLPSGALIEGFATALAPRSVDELDLHEQAAALDHLQRRPNLEDIMSLGFWASASSRAYTAAGSFCLWLLETRGSERLAALYRSGGDFLAAYGESLTTLESQWLLFLRGKTLPANTIEQQALRFRRRSVFARPCAHRAAATRSELERALEVGDFAGATTLARHLCSLEPEEFRHRLTLANTFALGGSFDQAREEAAQLLQEVELTPQERSPTVEFLGDLALLAGDAAEARRHYEAALALGVRGSQRRALQIRRYASLMADTSPEFAALVWAYFAPFDGQTQGRSAATMRMHAAARLAEVPRFAAIGEFLRARQLAIAQAPADAALAYERALSAPTGGLSLPSADLLRAAREGLLSAWLQVRQFHRARELLATMAEIDGQSSGARQDLALWRERLVFYEKYFGQ